MKKKSLLAAASLMAVLPTCAQTPGGVAYSKKNSFIFDIFLTLDTF